MWYGCEPQGNMKGWSTVLQAEAAARVASNSARLQSLRILPTLNEVIKRYRRQRRRPPIARAGLCRLRQCYITGQRRQATTAAPDAGAGADERALNGVA